MAASPELSLSGAHSREDRIPQELCDLVIDYVAEEAQKYFTTNESQPTDHSWLAFRALAAWSRTCYSCSRRSRPYLFRTLLFHTSIKVKKFFDLIKTSPDIKEYALAIHVQDSPRYPDDPRTWIHTVLVKSPSLLPNVRSISIQYLLRTMHPSLPIHCVGFKNVNSLNFVFNKFSSFGDFRRVISAFRTLRSLHIQISTGWPIPKVPNVNIPRNARTIALRLENFSFALPRIGYEVEYPHIVEDFLKWLFLTDSATSLTSVIMPVFQHNLELVHSFMQSFKELRRAHFSLAPGGKYDPVLLEDHFDLSHLRYLQSIEISNISWHQIPLFSNILSNVSSKTIKKVILSISRVVRKDVQDAEWEKIDGVFSNQPYTGVLEEVKVNILLWESFYYGPPPRPPSDYTFVETEVKRRLAYLNKKELLHLSISRYR
ncbi:hypothetical protein C8Q75DRAFT_802986 [Abortiporus biennis]|nr:hypothetical protein C8Q75DRAFT_802986 [Abortiporus biennis]